MSDIILSFDSSNSSCSVCLSRGVKILAYEEELKVSMQAERLLVMIESALQKTNLSYKDLGYLAVTVGPGSFTGIRIGLAAARGILMAASHIQGISITNFEAFAHRAKVQAKNFDKIIILINAYRGQLYFQEFDHNGNGGEHKLLDITEVVNYLQEKKGKVVCAGNGLEVISQEMQNVRNLILLPRFPRLKARHFALLAYEKMKRKEFIKIEPLYIRPPDAKIAGEMMG